METGAPEETAVAPIVGPPAASITPLAIEALAAARAYARDALAPETLRAYATDWAHFTAWCQAAGCAPLPAEPAAVAAYLYSLIRYAFTQPVNNHLLHRTVYLLYWVLLTVLVGGSRLFYRIIRTLVVDVKEGEGEDR